MTSSEGMPPPGGDTPPGRFWFASVYHGRMPTTPEAGTDAGGQVPPDPNLTGVWQHERERGPHPEWFVPAFSLGLCPMVCPQHSRHCDSPYGHLSDPDGHPHMCSLCDDWTSWEQRGYPPPPCKHPVGFHLTKPLNSDSCPRCPYCDAAPTATVTYEVVEP